MRSTPKDNHPWRLNSAVLDIKKERIIIGMVVQRDLKWQSQCQEMVRRATSTTWAIRRMKALGVSEVRLTEFWKSELESPSRVYLSSVALQPDCGPVQLAGPAQRVAMATITGWWEPSQTLQLIELGLDRLGPRRDLSSNAFRSAQPRIPAIKICFHPFRQIQGGGHRAPVTLNYGPGRELTRNLPCHI